MDESEANRYRKLSGDTRARLWWVVHEAITPSWEKQMVQKVEKKWKIPSPEELNRKFASRGMGTSDEQFEGYRDEYRTRPWLPYVYDPREKEKDACIFHAQKTSKNNNLYMLPFGL